MNLSVLEKDYVEATRPYSQIELKKLRKTNKRLLRVGTVHAQHNDCGHFYLTKFRGRKEQEILQTNNPNAGNCSVCWKLSKTPYMLRGNAEKLVSYINNNFFEEPSRLTYDLVEAENDYYTWLYNEFNH